MSLLRSVLTGIAVGAGVTLGTVAVKKGMEKYKEHQETKSDFDATKCEFRNGRFHEKTK